MKLIHGLHKDTLIEINGSYQKIGDIKLGDVVKGFDVHGVGVRDNKVVSVRTSTIDSYIEFKLSDGSIIKSSIDAKILTSLRAFSFSLSFIEPMRIWVKIELLF